MRILRTVLQVVIAEATAIPTAIAASVADAGTVAKVSGWCGLLVVVATVAHNTVFNPS